MWLVEAVRPGDFKFCVVLHGDEYQTCVVPVEHYDTMDSIKNRARGAMVSYFEKLVGGGEAFFEIYSEYLDRIIGRWDYVSEYEQEETYEGKKEFQRGHHAQSCTGYQRVKGRKIQGINVKNLVIEAVLEYTKPKLYITRTFPWTLLCIMTAKRGRFKKPAASKPA